MQVCKAIGPGDLEPGDKVILDFLSASHLGDALCATPLARLLSCRYGVTVRVVQHRSTRSVFAHNPYVRGFTARRGPRLVDTMVGAGHLIQRLQRAWGVPVDPLPRPEIYLSPAELSWCRRQRRQWPPERPVCILSTRVLTDKYRYDQDHLAWDQVAAAWSKHCTVVQPVLSSARLYAKDIAWLNDASRAHWGEDRPLPGAVIYEDLTLRQYMSLFAVADYFCGGTSGGAHVAAAFGVPALIVVWRELTGRIRFPCRGPRLSTETFLYPQHRFVVAEDIAPDRAGGGTLAEAIDAVMARADGGDRTRRVIMAPPEGSR